MKRILFAVMMALIVTAAFGASEPYRMPDGSTVEVMHPGVDGVTRPMARADATVVPAYPQLPQPLGEDSTVVMAVLVDKRGDAVTLEVLDSSHPGLGFEDSAAEALVGIDGKVEEVRITRVEGRDFGFEKATEETIYKWRYKPATKKGVRVRVWVTIRVPFRLQ